MMAEFPSITSEIQQIQEIEATISDVFKHCDKMKSDILEYSADATQDLKKLKNSMEKLAEQQRQLSGLSSAALQIEEMVQSENGDGDQLLEKFSNVIRTCKEEECIDDTAERAILAMDDYIASNQRKVQVDDDILVTETTESYKDPLTKLTIQDPVKSLICNHSYERKSILKYLERSRKCPHSGCVNTLSRGDLVDDLELKKKLMSLKEEFTD